MSDSRKGPPLSALAAGEPDSLYDALGGMLQWMLQRRFAIPPEDGQRLVREVFMVYHGLRPPPPDARSWLIAGACRGANAYLNARGLDSGGEARELAAVQFLLFDEAMELLPGRARTALRLRFGEGKTYEEIAAELGVSTPYAERIVSAAAAKLRGLIRSR